MICWFSPWNKWTTTHKVICWQREREKENVSCEGGCVWRKWKQGERKGERMLSQQNLENAEKGTKPGFKSDTDNKNLRSQNSELSVSGWQNKSCNWQRTTFFLKKKKQGKKETDKSNTPPKTPKDDPYVWQSALHLALKLATLFFF